MRDGGFTKASHHAACYVLIGYSGDTMDVAEVRLLAAWDAGFVPYAMLYRDETGSIDPDWRKFQRLWIRPQILFSRLKRMEASA